MSDEEYEYDNNDDYYEQEADSREEEKKTEGRISNSHILRDVDNLIICFEVFGQSSHYRLVQDYLFLQELKLMIKEIQNNYGISSGKALFVLQQMNYDVNKQNQPRSKIIDEIYKNIPPQMIQKEVECILCSEKNNLSCLDCGHNFCSSCWKSYLQAGIKSGLEFTILKRCPMDKCTVVQFILISFDILQYFKTQKQIIDLEYFKKYLNEPQYQLFEKFLLHDSLVRNKKVIQCPGKSCSNLIILNSFKGGLSAFEDAHFNVSCTCSFSFCSIKVENNNLEHIIILQNIEMFNSKMWRCKQDAHRPLACDTYIKWINLIGGKSSEEIDQIWIKLNTKKCPKCKVDIEKNQGCMHMTCKRCTYEFCWLCMGDWKKHVDCNKYSVTHQKEQDLISQQSGEELKRFNFFSMRFIEHKKSIEFAIQNKNKIDKQCNEILQQHIQGINFEFLYEAVRTVIECRRAVTYSYAMGYYAEAKKRPLLEFLQKDLETNLEKLDHLTERKITEFYDASSVSMKTSYYQFYNDVRNLTQILSKYFGNMIEFFEKVMILHSFKQFLDLPELSLNRVPSIKKNNQDNLTKKNDSIKSGEQFEGLDIWICNFCGHDNQLGFVICENCFTEFK